MMNKALDRSDYERMQRLFLVMFKWQRNDRDRKTLFRKLSLRFHPDKNHAACAKAAFQALSESYESLNSSM
jgi:preprotein translocase subunit Sec63